jgi:AraC family transcriptional regulator
MVRQREIGSSKDPVELARQLVPFLLSAGSDRLGWTCLHAARFFCGSPSEINVPPLPQHTLVLIKRSPDKLELRYEGVKRDKPPPIGSISVVPPDNSVQWRWAGNKDSLHLYLETSLLARVAAESFEFDLARTEVPPIDGLNAPHVRAAMLAVDAELTTGGAGGSLMVESLAHILAVQLIRHTLAPRRAAGRTDGTLPNRKLNQVVDYIMGNLDNSLTLDQMAAIAHLSPYHFARQFKTTTGCPPHQYVIARRVERAQQLLRANRDVTLAEVAQIVGFADQSHFSLHFKRIVGATPRQYQISARIA